MHADNSSESSSNAVFGDESEAERLSRLWFFYCRFLYAGHHHHSHTPSPAADHDAKTIRILSGAVFFHEEAVKVGQSLPFLFRPGRRATLGMLPRDAADSIPFSTPAIPGVLALLGIGGGRAAADMEETLSMCEAPPLVAGSGGHGRGRHGRSRDTPRQARDVDAAALGDAVATLHHPSRAPPGPGGGQQGC